MIDIMCLKKSKSIFNTVGHTFAPTVCFVLLVEPILERTLELLEAGAVLGRPVGFEALVAVVDVPDVVGRGLWGTESFFSVETGLAAVV